MNPNKLVRQKIRRMTKEERKTYLSPRYDEKGNYLRPEAVEDLIDKSRISQNGMKPNNFYTAVAWDFEKAHFFDGKKKGLYQRAIMMLNDMIDEEDVFEFMLQHMTRGAFEGRMLKYALDEDQLIIVRKRLDKQDAERGIKKYP